MPDSPPTDQPQAEPALPEQAAPAKPEAYADQRCREAGIPDEICLWRAPHPRSPDSHIKNQWSVFQSDEDDNLVILYPTIGGDVLTYDNGTKNNPESIFERKRLKEPRTYVDKEGNSQTMKYEQPKGTRQFPFFMPGLVAKYQAGTKIPTLYLVEGELKAAAGVARGLDIVGMPSNQVVRQQVGANWQLEGHLQELIRKCEVETLVLLHDADARTVRWEAGKDLAKRPNSFAQAVINFREAIQSLLDDEACALKRAFYLHGRRELCDKNAKGLDDMFMAFPDEQEAILADLAKGTEANKYFEGKNVTTPHYDNVRSYFAVNNKAKDPEKDFYLLYRKDIGIREFSFRGRRYVPDGEDVIYLAHQDAGEFCRIGADWYKWIWQPRPGGELVRELVPWKVGEISREYKNYPAFLDECPKFDGFTVEPNFNGDYQRVIAKNLNLIQPLGHEPAGGSIKHTLAFLKHIFTGTGTLVETETLKNGKPQYGTEEKPVTADPFTIALDWLTVLHNHPKHQLPVVILVSKDNKTGKTTFLNWLTWIYGSNATILNNDQFAMKFNAHYATKFVIGLDEAFQDLEKKAEKERLKQMVTAKEMYVERKGVDLKAVPFYGKIVMTSNEEDKVMKLDDNDTRWFVVKVPVFQKEDPDMEKKLRAEIPAWLHFLHQRQVHHPRESRLWFKPEDFITEQFRIIVKATKNRLDHNIEEFIKDLFLTYRLGRIRTSVKWLTKAINETSKYRVDEKDVRDYFKSKRGLEPQSSQRIKIPTSVNYDLLNSQGFPDTAGMTFHEEQARYYELLVQEWLSEQELVAFEAPYVADNWLPTSPAQAIAQPAIPGVKFGSGWAG